MTENTAIVNGAPVHALSGLGPGVVIETTEGPQPVEWLRPGDLLLTRDHGYRPVIWAGRSPLSGTPAVRIAAGALGNRIPDRDLVLSPAHHVLLRSPQIELHFATEEVLVPVFDIATDGETGGAMTDPAYGYCHILMEHHELILAEGVWLETLFPDAPTLDLLGPVARAEITTRLGHDALTRLHTARPLLHPGEAAVLHPRSAIAATRIAA
jgi:hypothetical protein